MKLIGGRRRHKSSPSHLRLLRNLVARSLSSSRARARSVPRRRVGLVAEEDIQTCVQELLVLMQPGCPAERAAAGVILSGIVRIRPLLCSPARARARPNQPWFLSHAELFDWITTCFNPSSRRPTCATRYDFANWGPWLEPIVRYFKSLPPQAQGTMGDLYDAVLGQ
jgi:hypothetical protein